jgi:membrane peptidoglycan carboxypeptidase
MHHPGYNIDTLRHLLSQEVANKRLGGSTITQQLAKYLFTDGERLWKRKIEELLYAVEMEKTLGKQRILNLYLNTVDWAPATCGAFEAAKLYFAVKPEDLSPIQAAWLAGILNKPHQAWQEQFKKNNPNISRVQEITRFMPAKVREMPVALNFAAAN